MTLTYEDTRIETPSLLECLKAANEKSILPILLRRKCYRRNCFVDDNYVGFVIVSAYQCTDVWYVDLQVSDESIIHVLASVRWWLTNDLHAEGILTHIPRALVFPAQSVLGLQLLSDVTDNCLCWCPA